MYVISQFYFPFSLFIFSLNVIGFIHQTSAEEIPAELRESIVLNVKHMADNEAFWEGDAATDESGEASDFAELCGNGCLSYHGQMEEQPNGGWIV